MEADEHARRKPERRIVGIVATPPYAPNTYER
jgi:hypothetical protein